MVILKSILWVMIDKTLKALYGAPIKIRESVRIYITDPEYLVDRYALSYICKDRA